MRRRSTALVSPAVDALRQIDAWPAAHNAAGRRDGAAGSSRGTATSSTRFGWASVTKLLVAYATLVAAEEGALDLDEPAGPAGSTVRHLLAHASGLRPGRPQPLGEPGRAAHLLELRASTRSPRTSRHARRCRSPSTCARRCCEPLGLGATFAGDAGRRHRPARSATCSRFGRELLAPTLVAPETLAEATSVQFPGLDGVLPGFGRQTPNDWGLGFELRDGKSPHWTGSRNSPRDVRPLRLGRDGDVPLGRSRARARRRGAHRRAFGDWAKAAWPALSDAVLSEGSRAAAG